jgi:hypothetical protein
MSLINRDAAAVMSIVYELSYLFQRRFRRLGMPSPHCHRLICIVIMLSL